MHHESIFIPPIGSFQHADITLSVTYMRGLPHRISAQVANHQHADEAITIVSTTPQEHPVPGRAWERLVVEACVRWQQQQLPLDIIQSYTIAWDDLMR